MFFPSRYLGEMADRLRPIRESVSGSKLHDVEDLFPLARQKLGVYGGRSLAFPIGVQVPLVGYHDEWLTPGGATPPASWQEYHALVSRVGEAPPVWPARDASITGRQSCCWPGRLPMRVILGKSRRCSTRSRWHRESPDHRSSERWTNGCNETRSSTSCGQVADTANSPLGRAAGCRPGIQPVDRRVGTSAEYSATSSALGWRNVDRRYEHFS